MGRSQAGTTQKEHEEEVMAVLGRAVKSLQTSFKVAENRDQKLLRQLSRGRSCIIGAAITPSRRQEADQVKARLMQWHAARRRATELAGEDEEEEVAERQSQDAESEALSARPSEESDRKQLLKQATLILAPEKAAKDAKAARRSRRRKTEQKAELLPYWYRKPEDNAVKLADFVHQAKASESGAPKDFLEAAMKWKSKAFDHKMDDLADEAVKKYHTPMVPGMPWGDGDLGRLHDKLARQHDDLDRRASLPSRPQSAGAVEARRTRGGSSGVARRHAGPGASQLRPLSASGPEGALKRQLQMLRATGGRGGGGHAGAQRRPSTAPGDAASRGGDDGKEPPSPTSPTSSRFSRSPRSRPEPE